ncbi:MAG: SpoIIE family protein phosphatase [Acidobacteriota bacterium]|nr:SpoIIE family protein phosphatase [Acidobacteriota bacterium]
MRRAFLIFLVVLSIGGAVALAVGNGLGASWLSGTGILALTGSLLLFLLWLSARVVQVFLWRVGRRLAFSYFLIGVLPIPMVGVLILLNAYLLCGFFLGHLYRDAAASVQQDLAKTAQAKLAGETAQLGPQETEIAYAIYERGWKVEGDPRLPYLWPKALADLSIPVESVSERERTAQYFVLPDGSATLLTAVGQGRRSAVTFLSQSADSELMRRTELWIGLLRSDDPRKQARWRLELGGRVFSLHPFGGRSSLRDRSAFLAERSPDSGWLKRPFLWWSEVSGSLRSVQDGSVVADHVTANLYGDLSLVAKHLFSSSLEFDTAILAGLVGVTGLLSSIYAIAAAMALYLIYTLSRAVNRLSRATEAVQRGDFSIRIPVRRTDQVGELQRSFNQMSANLETLVSTAAQKESLEKELRIARDLQRSLLPRDLPSSEAVEFATLFEPSAAIGGDYFDILRIDDSRIAVVIADVSGHGLPTGLRMAMLKAALVILVEEAKAPVEILRRLSAMVRAQTDERFFVTATVGVVDFRNGTLELTNAGHPPTYLMRGGEVEEILLPGNPLGALGEEYGQTRLDLEPGDILVWLSDGLIETTDPEGEPFGYDRTRESLEGLAGSGAEAARDRLLAAVARHAAGEPPVDDQTLVAMRYSGSVESRPRKE